MEQLQPLRPEPNSRRPSGRGHRAYSVVVIAFAAFLLLLVIRAMFQGREIPQILVATVVVGFVCAILVGTYFLVRALREYRESEARFQQMATNIAKSSG